MSKLAPLTRLPRELDKITDGSKPRLSYRSIYEKAVSGIFPAEQGDNGRWKFDPAKLHVIAEKLELD